MHVTHAKQIPLALALLAVSAGALVGQSVVKPEQYPLFGKVVDAETGAPLVAATVMLQNSGLRTYTDSTGHFRFQRVRETAEVLQVEQLGYVSGEFPITISARTRPVRVDLSPDPVLLKAITVLTDRFRTRRLAVPLNVVAFDRAAIVNAGPMSMVEFLGTQGRVRLFECPREQAGVLPSNASWYYGFGFGGLGSRSDILGCALIRGQLVQPAVWIDERPAFGDELALLHPQDLDVIEVYGGGRIIQVYTRWWMERNARRRLVPSTIY